MSAQTALATSWIGPSITPLTNLNSGFRVYEVDSVVRVSTSLRQTLTQSRLLRSDVRHFGCSHVSPPNPDSTDRREGVD